MTAIDFDALENLAGGMTPGKRIAIDDGYPSWSVVPDPPRQWSYAFGFEEHEAAAAAAFDRETLLALLALARRTEQAEHDLDALRCRVRSLAENFGPLPPMTADDSIQELEECIEEQRVRAVNAEFERDEARNDARGQFELGESYLASWFEAIDLCAARDTAIDACQRRIAEVMRERDGLRAENRTLRRHLATSEHFLETFRGLTGVHLDAMERLRTAAVQAERERDEARAAMAGVSDRPPLDPAHAQTLREMLEADEDAIVYPAPRTRPETLAKAQARIAALRAVLGEEEKS